MLAGTLVALGLVLGVGVCAAAAAVAAVAVVVGDVVVGVMQSPKRVESC